MIFFSEHDRTKRSRSRDGLPLLASSALRRQRKYSGLTGKESRRFKNEHRRHRKGIDKSNIHWTSRPTRKDINRQHKRISQARTRRRSRGWLW